jgi:hypothetical protein
MQDISLRPATRADAEFTLHVSEARTGVYAEQTWRPGMPVQISPCGRSHIQLRSMSLSSVARPTSVYLNGSNANRPLINEYKKSQFRSN